MPGDEPQPAPVPYDPELRAALSLLQLQLEPEPLVPETIGSFRTRFLEVDGSIEAQLAGQPVRFEDRAIPGPEGAPDLHVAILSPEEPASGAPGVYNIHGGGMVLGTRFGDASALAELVVAHGIVAVSIEYRLAPEHPHPAPVEDCYAGWLWTVEHAEELGIDRARLIVRGGSAGGGLGAACALMARDRGGPMPAGLLLMCPMIDDRNDTVSARQYDQLGLWNRHYNDTGWNALLGEARGGPDVSAYAAPARATDLSGLPPTFIDVGAAEVFRDEDVAFASALWAAGVQAELHVWSGAFHGFTSAFPAAPVSRGAQAARASWCRRLFGEG